VVHLVHPQFVHFAVAFLLAGSVAEAWGILGDRRRLERFGGRLVLLGTVALVPTVVSGFVAHISLAPPVVARAAISRHELLGLVTLAAYLVSTLWKAWDGGRVRETAIAAYAVWILGAAGALVATAWLGGHMVYGLGVGVDCAALSFRGAATP
jgi:uncharacterized membrane protein